MKEKINFVKNILIILYILLIIFITICLLSYNDYKITEFGNITILPVIDEYLKPDYNVGDLLILKKNVAEVKEGDIVFFYRTTFGETVVNFAKVTNIEIVTMQESTITVEGDYEFSSRYLIGRSSDITIIPVAGRIISILESKYGFLFLGILPSLLVFLYTGYTLFLEVNTDDSDEEEDEEKADKKSEPDKIEEEKVETEKPKEEKEKEQEEKKPKEKKVKEKKKEEKLEETEVPENNDDNKEEKEVEQETNTEKKTMTEEEKKILIQEKMKSMTEEEKRALIEAKLKTMTEEEKKALIDAKRKKLEENK